MLGIALAEKAFDQYNHTGHDLLAKAACHSTQAGIQHESRLRKLQPLLFSPGTKSRKHDLREGPAKELHDLLLFHGNAFGSYFLG